MAAVCQKKVAVIGGGAAGLISASVFAKSGFKVCVLMSTVFSCTGHLVDLPSSSLWQL